MKASWIRWAILALLYVVFLSWYGGSGDPLSPGEIEEYVAIAQAQRAENGLGELSERDREVAVKLREFMETDDGQEFVMINLNVYRDVPRYEDGREVSGSAEEVEQEYARRILPNLLVRATHPLLMLDPEVSIGGTGEFERQDWTRVNLVRYRSRRDFLDFICHFENPQVRSDFLWTTTVALFKEPTATAAMMAEPDPQPALLPACKPARVRAPPAFQHSLAKASTFSLQSSSGLCGPSILQACSPPA